MAKPPPLRRASPGECDVALSTPRRRTARPRRSSAGRTRSPNGRPPSTTKSIPPRLASSLVCGGCTRLSCVEKTLSVGTSMRRPTRVDEELAALAHLAAHRPEDGPAPPHAGVRRRDRHALSHALRPRRRVHVLEHHEPAQRVGDERDVLAAAVLAHLLDEPAEALGVLLDLPSPRVVEPIHRPDLRRASARARPRKFDRFWK